MKDREHDDDEEEWYPRSVVEDALRKQKENILFIVLVIAVVVWFLWPLWH